MVGTRPEVQMQTPRDFLKTDAPAGRLLGPRARPRACAVQRVRQWWERVGDWRFGVLLPALSWLSFQAHTECSCSQKQECGSDPAAYVEEWYSVNCTIASNKENVTVAAELSLTQSQLPVPELHILGEISFNKSLYEGLNAENHRTKITVIFLKEEYYLPVVIIIILSSVSGLLALTVIIIILFQCGFFKRKYQHVNLDSTRKAQLKSENLLAEEN